MTKSDPTAKAVEWRCRKKHEDDFKCGDNWNTGGFSGKASHLVPCSGDTIVFSDDDGAVQINVPSNSYVKDVKIQNVDGKKASFFNMDSVGGDVISSQYNLDAYQEAYKNELRGRISVEGNIHCGGQAACRAYCVNTCSDKAGNSASALEQQRLAKEAAYRAAQKEALRKKYEIIGQTVDNKTLTALTTIADSKAANATYTQYYDAFDKGLPVWTDPSTGQPYVFASDEAYAKAQEGFETALNLYLKQLEQSWGLSGSGMQNIKCFLVRATGGISCTGMNQVTVSAGYAQSFTRNLFYSLGNFWKGVSYNHVTGSSSVSTSVTTLVLQEKPIPVKFSYSNADFANSPFGKGVYGSGGFLTQEQSRQLQGTLDYNTAINIYRAATSNAKQMQAYFEYLARILSQTSGVQLSWTDLSWGSPPVTYGHGGGSGSNADPADFNIVINTKGKNLYQGTFNPQVWQNALAVGTYGASNSVVKVKDYSALVKSFTTAKPTMAPRPLPTQPYVPGVTVVRGVQLPRVTYTHYNKPISWKYIYSYSGGGGGSSTVNLGGSASYTNYVNYISRIYTQYSQNFAKTLPKFNIVGGTAEDYAKAQAGFQTALAAYLKALQNTYSGTVTGMDKIQCAIDQVTGQIACTGFDQVNVPSGQSSVFIRNLYTSMGRFWSGVSYDAVSGTTSVSKSVTKLVKITSLPVSYSYSMGDFLNSPLGQNGGAGGNIDSATAAKLQKSLDYDAAMGTYNAWKNANEATKIAYWKYMAELLSKTMGYTIRYQDLSWGANPVTYTSGTAGTKFSPANFNIVIKGVDMYEGTYDMNAIQQALATASYGAANTALKYDVILPNGGVKTSTTVVVSADVRKKFMASVTGTESVTDLEAKKAALDREAKALAAAAASAAANLATANAEAISAAADLAAARVSLANAQASIDEAKLTKSFACIAKSSDECKTVELELAGFTAAKQQAQQAQKDAQAAQIAAQQDQSSASANAMAAQKLFADKQGESAMYDQLITAISTVLTPEQMAAKTLEIAAALKVLQAELSAAEGSAKTARTNLDAAQAAFTAAAAKRDAACTDPSSQACADAEAAATAAEAALDMAKAVYEEAVAGMIAAQDAFAAKGTEQSLASKQAVNVAEASGVPMVTAAPATTYVNLYAAGSYYTGTGPAPYYGYNLPSWFSGFASQFNYIGYARPISFVSHVYGKDASTWTSSQHYHNYIVNMYTAAYAKFNTALPSFNTAGWLAADYTVASNSVQVSLAAYLDTLRLGWSLTGDGPTGLDLIKCSITTQGTVACTGFDQVRVPTGQADVFIQNLYTAMGTFFASPGFTLDEETKVFTMPTLVAASPSVNLAVSYSNADFYHSVLGAHGGVEGVGMDDATAAMLQNSLDFQTASATYDVYTKATSIEKSNFRTYMAKMMAKTTGIAFTADSFQWSASNPVTKTSASDELTTPAQFNMVMNTKGLSMYEGAYDMTALQSALAQAVYAAAKAELKYDALVGGLTGNQETAQKEFNDEFWKSERRVIRRECANCAASHKDIYYKRITEGPGTWNAWANMVVYWEATNNVMGTDFNLYSTQEDADQEMNAWTAITYDTQNKVAAFAFTSGPTAAVEGQWNSLTKDVSQPRIWQDDYKFSVAEGSAPAMTPTKEHCESISQNDPEYAQASEPKRVACLAATKAEDDAGGIPIWIFIIAGVVVVCIIGGVAMYALGGGGGGGKTPDDRNVVAFENPMYDDPGAGGDQGYGGNDADDGMYGSPAVDSGGGGADDLYDEPEFGGGASEPGGGSGYLDVAPDDDDDDDEDTEESSEDDEDEEDQEDTGNPVPPGNSDEDEDEDDEDEEDEESEDE